MGDIERWTIKVCPVCGEEGGGYDCAGTRSEPHALADYEAVEVARATDLRGAVDLLRDVANAGVAFDDPRIDYVEVQIDRPTWTALVTYRGR